MIKITPIQIEGPESLRHVEEAVKVLAEAGWTCLLLHYSDGSRLMRPMTDEEKAMLKRTKEESK